MARYQNNNSRSSSRNNHYEEEEDSFEAAKDDYYYGTDRDERRRDRREGRYGDFTSRDRGGDWDRERYRDQGGDYDYRRAPNRDWERERERDYNRERDRDRERGDRYEERERYDQRNFERDYDHRDRDSRGAPPSASEKPSKIIMLRGLPQSVDEDDIRLELQAFGAPLKEVRLMKRKETGASRGFAFVEFENLQDATRWMEQNQHQLMLRGQRVNMHYSTPKPQKEEDWQCSKCGVHNFKRRDHCFKCGISREESSKTLKEGEGYNEVGSQPSNTLIFRGLDTLTTEETIRATLGALSTVHIHSIRLIKDKLTHTSRGFCFVEMTTVEEAAQMMDVLMAVRPAFAIDGKQVNVAFAKQGKAGSSAPSGVAAAAIEAAQWSQAQAQGTDQSWDQTHQYSQGFTALATQDGQFTPEQMAEYAAYLQSGDYSAYYQQHGIDLAQYQQLAAAAAQAAAAGGTGAAQTALEQVQAAQQFQKQQQIIQQQIVTQMQAQQKLSELSQEERLALQVGEMTAQELGRQAQQWSQQVAQYQQVIDPAAVTQAVVAATTAAMATTSPVSTATVAMVTQAAISAATSLATPTVTIPLVSLDQQSYQVYPTPDLSTFQYDETSGYYYDPQTSLYYDASTQYFYNSGTQQYLYWDQDKQTYLPAPTDSAEQHDADGKDSREEKKKKKEKSAQKIAKDMERWAKSLNQQKETKKFVPIGGFKPSQKPGEEKVSATADAGYAILEKKASLAERQQSVLEALQRKKEEDVKPSPVRQNSLVDAYGGGSDSEEEEDDAQKKHPALAPDEEQLLDWKRMACLLCKRQFPSKEALSRHQQLSDLHKTNLEMRRRSTMTAEELEALEKRERDMKYRDRAAERRQKFGIPEPPPPKRKREDYLGKVQASYEEPTKHGIGSENIGNKMLKAMGWAEGTGLGKKKQGITAPITAEKRTMGAGLGAKGGSYGTEAGDTYKESVKKIMRQRYYET